MYAKPNLIAGCIEGIKDKNGSLFKAVHFGPYPYSGGGHCIVVNEIEVIFRVTQNFYFSFQKAVKEILTNTELYIKSPTYSFLQKMLGDGLVTSSGM